MRFPAPVTGALAALALMPAVATAAPNREGELAALDTTYEWASDVQTGFVYTSDVSNNLDPCTPAVFSCDQTLIRTGELGDLKFSIAGSGIEGQDTLSDVDVFVFASDEAGTAGEQLGADTSADARETVLLEDAPAGYYLVRVDWYLGAGSIDGLATLSTPVDEEEIPEEEF
jgi:hypothetical protein